MRVLIGDDDVLLRGGLASLFTGRGHEVVGVAGDGPAVVRLAAETAPDLVVTDIRMPPTHTTEGIDAAREIRAVSPDTGVLVVSAHVEADHALELLAVGRGFGYLLKARIGDVDEFLDAAERVARGGSAIDPALVEELVGARRRRDPLAGISAREREVLAQMAEGRSNAGIAKNLWISEGTVEKHVRSILAKLDLASDDDDHRRVLAVLRFLEAS